MEQPWRQCEQIPGKIANVTVKEKKVLTQLHMQSQIFMPPPPTQDECNIHPEPVNKFEKRGVS